MREQLSDQNVGLILQEMEAGQHLEQKDTADCNPTYKRYWAQRKFLAVSDGILEHHWESANG
jgi:hypothetical protein